MGRSRKRFNENARRTNEAQIHHKDEIEVALDMKIPENKYDNSNPLIICGKKKIKKKVAVKNAPVTKQLSKKQKKKLAKILEKKKKKMNRVEVLEKLSKVQAKPEELDYLASTASVQTYGIKKLNQKVLDMNTKKKISSIKMSKKSKKLDQPIVQDSSEDSDEESEDECVEEFAVKSPEDTAVEGLQDDRKSNSLLNIDDNSVINNETTVCNEEPDLKSGNMIEVEHTLNNDKKDNKLEVESNKDAILNTCSPAVHISVNRLPEIQASREKLPIFCEEQSIMEAINENSVVVIHGETGSGKTTQVPQFLYEAGYAQNGKIIGVTEPRRIAAMTMSSRVGTEMNLPEAVSYHVRYDKDVKDETKIKFMTDGILLREIKHDFLLTQYSVIIIDEAHERSVFSDVLIGLLSRIVPLRNKRKDPLKLIIMSATIRVQDFMDNPVLFKETPFLIKLDSRQYKVQIHFNIQTPSDYIEAAYQKVCKIHRQLPAGAILVFLTGEKEVTKLCKMLRKTFPFKDDSKYKSGIEKGDSIFSPKISRKKKKAKLNEDKSFCDLPSEINLDNYSVEPLDIESIQHHLSDGDASDMEIAEVDSINDGMPLYTLPLYSILPFEEQEKVFKPPPEGSRLCVVSTNVAETSITIPGLKYVVDSGKVKNKVYNMSSGGISQFTITWISKASANQRAGRAGRTEGGHCYRLYSSAIFEHDFPEFAPPEIQRMPVDDILLQMKALGIDRVVNFPFPSPPDKEALKAAEKRLVLLGALQDLQKGERYKDIQKWEYSAKITELGKAMSRFPVSPRYAKMILLAYKHQCLKYIIAIVSSLTVPEVFLYSSSNDNDNEDSENNIPWKGIKKIGAGKGKSLQLGDAIVLLRAVALYTEVKNKAGFCYKNCIRLKAMIEINKMCIQLLREVNKAFPDLKLPMDMKVDPPNDQQIEILQKILTTGFTDHVAKKVSAEEAKENKELKNAYKCLELEDPVFIHPSSILFSELPEYIIYQEIVHTSKYYMKGIVEINPAWLPAFAPTYCNFSDPLEDPPPSYNYEKDHIICNMEATFGRYEWQLPTVLMEMPKGFVKYNWFCFFLLDGQIHPFFSTYRKEILSCPSTILKSWAKLLPRTRNFLQAVIAKQVDSRMSLLDVWKQEPKFLLREYWEWLPEDKHLEVECKWPPL